jgi:hypothetical protein
MQENLNALERLVEAIYELVTNAGRVQERIFEAELYLDRIVPDELPEGKLRNQFVAIKNDLTFKPEGDPASPTGSLQGMMTDHDASEIARRILRLHYELQEWIDELRVR